MTDTQRPVYKPSRVMRLVKAGKIPDRIPGGRYQCLRCGHVDRAAGTESPMFHENGMYHGCKGCGKHTLHRVLFPACPGHPEGFEIDTTGERKQYPVTMGGIPA